MLPAPRLPPDSSLPPDERQVTDVTRYEALGNVVAGPSDQRELTRDVVKQRSADARIRGFERAPGGVWPVRESSEGQ